MLAIASSAVGAAATKEEVAHCRAIENPSERLDCFKSLKRSPNAIDHLPGQPLCVDREALAAMILAGLLTSDPTKAATRGCQSIPDDAKLELLERYPGVFPFMRMIRVKVTSPTRPELTSGFTIEMGR
jgi:hypothetical protein